MNQTRWTDADYEQMNWHDNHIHAFRFEEKEMCLGNLIFDVDHILEWIKVDNHFNFVVVPVRLTFFEVHDLVLSLDYKTPSAALQPMMIDGIERSLGRNGSKAWRIYVNWPHGEFTFNADGFEQVTVGKAERCEGQQYPVEMRTSIRI